MSIESILTFIADNSMVEVTLLFVIVAWCYFHEKKSMMFRQTMYDFRKETEKQFSKQETEIKHLDRCIHRMSQGKGLEHV